MKKAALLGATAIAATVGLTPAAHASSTNKCTYSNNGSYHFCATITHGSADGSSYTSVTLTSLTAPSTTQFRWTVSIDGSTGLVWSNQSGSQPINTWDGYHSLVLRLNEATYGQGSLSLP